MNPSKTITVADLFCGAGGLSTGLRQAGEQLGLVTNLLAVNHWETAIATHAANHPEAKHLCTGIENVEPRKAVPGGKLDLLIAAPSCTHHSRARGGKPINDQMRVSAWRIVEWCAELHVKHVLIENVEEMLTWGPLNTKGRPIQSRKGETFAAFAQALRSLGYTVEWRVLNAADYGDATTRRRLFIQARLGKKPIRWPEPTHAPIMKTKPDANGELFDLRPTRKAYRTAREIIDWSIPGESIFTRKRPLRTNTLNRIFRGLEKFAGIPYLVKFFGGYHSQSLDEPLPTVTANYEHFGLAQPYIVIMRNNADAQSLDEPLRTLTTGGNFGLAQPFIVQLRHGQSAQSVDAPLSTITTKGAHHAVCEPFLIPFFGERERQKPRVHSVNAPLPTVTGQGAGALVQPFIIPTNHGQDERSHDINRPMPTITSVDAWALIEPYLVKYNGTGRALRLDEPLDTITTKDRFGLVEPVGLLDIRFRMLQPHELSAAMSFPKTYCFAGTRSDKVKQIGNAVAVGVAQALCKTILEDL